jgi:hypothetical protein
MSQEKRYSDEFLNAFVDDQLAAEEKSRAYIEISQDEALNRQVCELRKLRDLVQLAYREVPTPPARAPATRRHRLAIGSAATVVLTVGVVLGLQIKLPGTAPGQPQSAEHAVPAVRPATLAGNRGAPLARPAPAAVASLPAASRPQAASAAPDSTVAVTEAPDLSAADKPRSINDVHIGNVRNKVLIHIANDDAPRLAQALEEIEGLMRYYRDSRQSAHVEVVINGAGLKLVRVDTSAHAAQIARLQREYDNLTFAACQNTIDRLKREQGITARLLPGVVVTDSGMAEIMRRQHQGWTYLQV